MKNKKRCYEKVTMKFDWFELLELYIALKNDILRQIKIEKIMNKKYPYYESDKDILKLYKRLVNQFKRYK